MKQYFMQGIDEPLEFGDILGFDIVKEGDNGKSITKHVECKLTKDTLPFLLEADVISEKEVKDEPSVEDTLGINPDSQDKDNDTDSNGSVRDDNDSLAENFFNMLDETIGNLTDIASDNIEAITVLQNKVSKLEKEVKKLKKPSDILLHNSSVPHSPLECMYAFL